MLKIILMVVIAYLLGSIPSGLWIGQHFYNKDIRQLGSGKGTLAASQPYLFHSNINPLLIGIFASLGHTVSIFDHFHGGKAVATSAGILLAYNPPMFLLASAIFVAVLLITSMASAASIIGITSIFVIALVMHDYILATVAGILTAVVIYRHRSNINRIIHGQESMVSFGLGHYLKNRK